MISVPTYSGYTYEIYGHPTLADLEWKALPLSITQTCALDRRGDAGFFRRNGGGLRILPSLLLGARRYCRRALISQT